MTAVVPTASLRRLLPDLDGLGKRMRIPPGWRRPLPTPVRAAVARGRVVGDWLSPAGWICLGGVLVGLPLGLGQDWTEFQALGLTCAFALVSALAWTLGRTSLEVTFALDRTRVTAGETAIGQVSLRNKGRRFLFPARIELAVGEGKAPFTLPPLAKDDVHDQLFEIPTQRRGVIAVGPVSSVRSDPLRLLQRVQKWSEAVDLYVHPVTVPLAGSSTGFIRDIEGVTTQDLSSNDVSFHALREYQPGDDRRAIHWRTTARVGQLMVRQFEETRRAHLLIVLPTSLEDYSDEQEMESAISVAASLARHAFAEEREVSIYTSAGLLTAGSAPLMLDRLAELVPAETRPSLRDLTRRALRAVPQTSVCALVAGALSDPRDLRSAHLSVPLSVVTFALRCSDSAPLARRRIGDLALVDLPGVDHLARAMRTLE